MIKITSVEIDGFIVPDQKIKLDFVESNVVCIYGNNGAGKTSLLEILFAVFSRDEEKIEEYKVNQIKLEYKLDTSDIEVNIKRLKSKKEQLTLELEKEYKSLEFINKEEDREKYKFNNIKPIENGINTLEEDIKTEMKSLDNAIGIVYIDKIDSLENNKYNWSEIANSPLRELSSLFLGIGRGIHKNEFKIPKEMIWHFFRNNKKISENKILTGNEIDEFSDRLIEHITPKDKNSEVEIYKAKELDNKKNIYLPSIDIDTIEAFLNIKYKEAVLDAKEKIEKALSKTSLNFFQPTISEEIDLKELREKLLYNQTLLLEMFSKTENIGIKTIFDSLDKNEFFLEEIDSSKQTILSNMVKELQSEVELFNEIRIFLDEYNQFLNYDKNLVLSANGIYITPENHSIQKLSSGERHLLTFLATILLMGEEQDFILLDEPEISLDIEWQEKLLSTISKLAPDSQIIVASHSPSIMGDYFDESFEINICNE